jgi:hypothetical protein
LAVAVSCSDPDTGMLVGFEGVTTKDAITGAWQLKVVDPVMPLLVAEIVAWPAAVALGLHTASPPETVATPAALEAHAAVPVRSWLGPEE